MTEGVLPVELPKNYKKASRYNSEVTKKRPEPQKAQTLPIGSKAPSLGERSDTGQPGQGTAVTSAEDSDPDSEVERAQIALLEAKKKKAERKKARTMDDTLPHQPDTAQASQANHPLHPTGFPYPHAYPHAPWNPARHPAHWQAAPFTMPGSPSPSIMSPAGSEWPGSPASTGSGNFTYNVTSGSYNDNSIRRITKGGMIRSFLPYPQTVLLIAYIAGRRKTTNRDYDGSN